MNITNIKNGLAEFRGTSTYHKHLFPGKSPIQLTDGCNYVRESCKAYWLFDAILFYQEDKRLHGKPFQIWTLEQKQNDLSWLLSCKESKTWPAVITQKIEYSDFPLEMITIWVINKVALLPSEY